jgi:FkbM family methyltransferase
VGFVLRKAVVMGTTMVATLVAWGRRGLVLTYRAADSLLLGTGIATVPPVRALDAIVRGWISQPLAEVLGHKMYLDKLDSLRLGVFGIHEPVETRWIQEHVPTGGVAIDIGANIGYHTLLLARQVGPNGHVYAFEPDPDNFALLTRNVALNGYRNVTLEQAALSDATGTLRLYRSATNLGDHRLFDSGDGRPFVEVPALPLDEYFRAYSGRLDYVKMDIQGGEASALAGMRGVLARYPSVALSSEFWPAGLTRAGRVPASYIAALLTPGRRGFEIDESAVRIVETTADDLLLRYTPANGRVTTVLSLPPRGPSGASD